jgi:hypothetical protein
MLKTLKQTFLVFLISFIGLNYVLADAGEKQDTCEILLIGSSYFNYNNLKEIIKNLADSSNKETYIEMHGQNGMYLSDHAASPATEAKINERNWDYVILQGVGVLVAYPDSFPDDHPVYPALVTLRDKIQANCETTRMLFQMPWAFEDGMTWYQNWTDTYEDMQIHIYDNTLQYSDEIGFEIAPVGWAWYAVLEEYNYPLHYLHMGDWNHPSLKGSYLLACTIYTTVFQESVVGNTYHCGISEEEVEFYQAIASDTVLNNLELWNIAPLVSVGKNPLLKNKIQLNQNYPNPFSDYTTVSFSLNCYTHIRLEVYNIEGQPVNTLINELRYPGTYSVIWDGKNKSGKQSCKGTYYFQLATIGSTETKKVILLKNNY